MTTAVRLANALAVIFSLVVTYIGIKTIAMLSPLTGAGRYETGLLLSLPLLATPMLYVLANGFCQQTFVKNPQRKTGPSRAVSALAVASALAIAMQVLSCVIAHLGSRLIVAAAADYVCLAVVGGLAGTWLVRRHAAVPPGITILAIGVFWLANTLVNYVLMNQAGMAPDTADLGQPVMRLVLFLGILAGGLVPALWLWLWLWLSGKSQRRRTAGA